MIHHTCPSCGHEFVAKSPNHQRAARCRLKGTTKRQRSAAMKALAARRWAAKRAAADAPAS